MIPMFIFTGIIIILAVAAPVIAGIATKRKRITISDDGHIVRAQQDVTCSTQYGHDHPEQPQTRYIVHEDPESGFVILNGVKRKISDCKYL